MISKHYEILISALLFLFIYLLVIFIFNTKQKIKLVGKENQSPIILFKIRKFSLKIKIIDVISKILLALKYIVLIEYEMFYRSNMLVDLAKKVDYFLYGCGCLYQSSVTEIRDTLIMCEAMLFGIIGGLGIMIAVEKEYMFGIKDKKFLILKYITVVFAFFSVFIDMIFSGCGFLIGVISAALFTISFLICEILTDRWVFNNSCKIKRMASSKIL